MSGAPPIPSLTAQAGPSSAGSDATTTAGVTTGVFSFKAPPTGIADVLKTYAPFIAIGIAIWAMNRRKK